MKNIKAQSECLSPLCHHSPSLMTLSETYALTSKAVFPLNSRRPVCISVCQLTHISSRTELLLAPTPPTRKSLHSGIFACIPQPPPHPPAHPSQLMATSLILLSGSCLKLIVSSDTVSPTSHHLYCYHIGPIYHYVLARTLPKASNWFFGLLPFPTVPLPAFSLFCTQFPEESFQK